MVSGLAVQNRDLDLLRSLFESRIMTAAHIAELHFEGRHQATKKRLHKLKSAGFIAERARRVSDPAVLFLTTKALKLLQEQGVLAEYPRFDIPALTKRFRVSDQTIHHELEVMDVKAAFHSALRGNADFRIDEFCTWPACYEFEIVLPGFGREHPVRPDGFIRVHEAEVGTKGYEHAFFLEVDRSSKVQERLARQAACYVEYFKCGGFAERMGGTREEPKEYPFRVLMVFKNAERRNNLAETLLRMNPPVFTQVWLSTFNEVKANPLGAIWIRPRAYLEVTKGTRFDPERERKSWNYKRETEREVLVEGNVKKIALFEKLA